MSSEFPAFNDNDVSLLKKITNNTALLVGTSGSSASGLTGTTLASNVINSSLTSFGYSPTLNGITANIVTSATAVTFTGSSLEVNYTNIGAINQPMPAASSYIGRMLLLKNTGPNTVTLDATSAGQFNHTGFLQDSYQLAQGDAVLCVSDGVSWFVGSKSANAAMPLTLQKWKALMSQGGTVGITVYGDSITYGQIGSTGAQANPTPVQTLQTTLQGYYQNNNITCTNQGVQGWGTNNWLGIWNATIAADSNGIFIINLGHNNMTGAGSNPFEDPNATIRDLRQLVAAAKAQGKTVVLEGNTPMDMGNPTSGSNAVLSTYYNRIYWYTEILKNVANEFACPFIDTTAFMENLRADPRFPSIVVQGDGSHPEQSVYNRIGRFLAGPFILGDVQPITGPCQIPITRNNVQGFISGTKYFYGVGAVYGSYIIATGGATPSVTIAYDIEVGGLESMIAFGSYTSTSGAIVVARDGATVSTVNLTSTNTSSNYGGDNLITISNNETQGVHFITVTAASGVIPTFYLRFQPAMLSTTFNRVPSGGTTDGTEMVQLMASYRFVTTSSANSAQLTPFATSGTLHDWRLTFRAAFPDGCGIILNGWVGVLNGMTTGAGVGGGQYLHVTGSGLIMSDSTGAAWTNSTTLTASVAVDTWHNYEVQSRSGVFYIFVDGVQAGSAYTPSIASKGGFIGFGTSLTSNPQFDIIDLRYGNYTSIGSSGGAMQNPVTGTSLDVYGSSKLSGKVTTYNSVVTDGWGVSAIQRSAEVTAQSSNNASIATYTVGASDGTFEVSAQVNITAATSISTTITCTYTDKSNTSRIMIFPIQQLTGSFIAGGLITGTGSWETPVMHIRCKAATTITIGTTAGTFTGVTYSADATIVQKA